MSISLPVIDNMFVGVATAAPSRSGPPGINNTNQPYRVSSDGPHMPDMANTIKADNNPGEVGGKPLGELLRNSESMLRKRTAAGPPTDGRVATACPATRLRASAAAKRKSPDTASLALPFANLAQLALAKNLLAATAALRVRIPSTSRTPWQLQRAAKTLCKPVRSANNLSSNGLKPALSSHYERLIATDMQQEASKPAGKVALSNPKAVATEGLASKKLGAKSIIEAAAGGEATPGYEKPAVAGISPASIRQIVQVLQGRLVLPQREHPDNNQSAEAGPGKSKLPGGESSIAGTVAGVVRQKAQLLDNPFPKIYQSPPDTEHQTSVSPEKSRLTGGKPTHKPAPISREPEGKPGGTASQIFSESVQDKEQAGNLLRKSCLHELNVAEFHRPAGQAQAKDRSSSASGKGFLIDFARACSSDHSQVSVSQPQLGSTGAPKGAHTASPGNASSTVSEQIMESIRGSLQQGDRGITIRLHPPELGKVVVRLQERQDQITGLLEVSKAETRYEIDRALPQIIHALRDSGVRIERLDVLLADQSGRQAGRDEVPQNGSFQQDYSAEGGNPDNKSNYEQLTDTPGSAYQDGPEPQAQISDNSINMLI